uniref:Uncharacterized protein n=1 Tax=Tanacetum cinerariifolium TaxID=118510 RepID=A0A699H7V7_TANCI|nr:hypothetical protein [Tanacetum cinerariifolium]
MWGLKECSSCGALYTKSCACSKGGFVDKFVHDPNKTPESSQRPPHDCPMCGSPVDGLYCRHCALLRKKLKEVWFTICDEHKFFQDFLNTSESSNNDSNVVSMPQEPNVFNQDPSENSLQSPPQIHHHRCYGCGNSLDAWLQQRKDQVCQKIPLCCDDDDDEESSIPLRDIIISELPSRIAITPVEEICLIEKLLYDNSSPRPPKEFIFENSDAAIKSFSPSPILIEDSDSLRDEIDLSLTLDDSMPPGIEDDDYDSEGDILILEEFLSNDSFSLHENESFHFDISSSPRRPAKPPDDDEIEPN